jgi:hypothetical protein
MIAERRNVLALKASFDLVRMRRRKNETTSPTTNSPATTPAMIPMMEPRPKPSEGFGTMDVDAETPAALAEVLWEDDGDATGTPAVREFARRGVEDVVGVTVGVTGVDSVGVVVGVALGVDAGTDVTEGVDDDPTEGFDTTADAEVGNTVGFTTGTVGLTTTVGFTIGTLGTTGLTGTTAAFVGTEVGSALASALPSMTPISPRPTMSSAGWDAAKRAATSPLRPASPRLCIFWRVMIEKVLKGRE